MAPQEKKKINLALQGGGAHGAFTWGVLDAFLEDDRFEFEGISATSAGAMNAAALAQGLHTGGAPKARELLERFWEEVSKTSAVFGGGTDNPFMKFWGGEAATYNMFDVFSNAFSPYQFNPLNINPLRDVLEKIINFDDVQVCDCVRLFITATDVVSGTAKIFENEHITVDSLLASACLPLLFQAVEIKGRSYWDGGYLGNPSLWPLFYKTKSCDIILVHVNPLRRPEIPKDPMAIESRLNEITFNASLIGEMRAIAFVQKLLRDEMLKDEFKEDYKDILLHAIRADEALGNMDLASKFKTDLLFLRELRDAGRSEAKKWLKMTYSLVGERSSVNIAHDYLG